MQIRINIPDDLYNKIQEQAQKEYRSVPNYVASVLHTHLSTPIPTPPQFIPHNTPGGMQIPDTPPVITASTPSTPAPQSTPASTPNTTPGSQTTPPTPTLTRRTVIDFEPPALSTIEDYETRLCNPDDEFYYRVKEYFLKHKQPERFLTLLQLVNSTPPTPLAKIKEDYIMSIYDALNTPVGYDLTTHEWKDLLSSFKIKN